MTAIPPGFTVTELRIKAAAEAYAAEFRISLDEVREWYASASDKEGLVCYMEDMVEREKEWRREIVAEMRARNAALRGAEPASSAERPLEGTVMRKEGEC